MKKTNILLIIILLVLILISIAITISYRNMNTQNGTATYTILICLVDPTEHREGPGAVDMAYVVVLKNGSISKLTPVYPGDMTHPTAKPPDYLAQQGQTKLYLHDSFWWKDLNKDAKLAQEIVKYKTGIKTDGVVVVKPEAVDAVIEAIGPIYVPNQGTVYNDSLIFLRKDQKENNISRGEAVESLGNAIKNASQEESKKSKVINIILDQNAKGNIIVIPQTLQYQLIFEEALKKLF